MQSLTAMQSHMHIYSIADTKCSWPKHSNILRLIFMVYQIRCKESRKCSWGFSIKMIAHISRFFSFTTIASTFISEVDYKFYRRIWRSFVIHRSLIRKRERYQTEENLMKIRSQSLIAKEKSIIKLRYNFLLPFAMKMKDCVKPPEAIVSIILRNQVFES